MDTTQKEQWKEKRVRPTAWLARTAAAAALLLAGVQAAHAGYDVGVGKADITAVELGSLSAGFVFDPPYDGLQSRQFVRAFDIEDGASRREVMVVVAELGLASGNLKRVALQQLQVRYPGRFTDDNFVLTMTHTHGVPNVGNASNPRLFKAQVDGVVKAVEAAMADKAPGSIEVNRGQLRGVGANRSAQAFVLNKPEDQAVFPERIDTGLTQLRFVRNGAAVGALMFYGLHPTNMIDEAFSFISTDNYGHAARRLEDDVDQGRPAGSRRFVAAFAQTGTGDVTPNINFKNCNDVDPPFWVSWKTHVLARHDWGCNRGSSTLGPFESMRDTGDKLFAAAKSLLVADAVAGKPVDAGVPSNQRLNYQYKAVDFAKIAVSGKYTGGHGDQATCDPAWGSAFAAGSSEDMGSILAQEGADNRTSLAQIVSILINLPLVPAIVKPLLDASYQPITSDVRECQGRKDVLAALVPGPTSLQVVKLGSLTLAFTPFELTTMTQYRIRRHLAATLNAGVDDVIAVGYSSGTVPSLQVDSTGGYVVTPEEYDSKQYESGYTAWGKWTQPALAQALDVMAATLVASDAKPSVTPVVPAPQDPLVVAARTPEDKLPAAVPWDGVPLFSGMGVVLKGPQVVQHEVNGKLQADDKRRFLEATFVSSHPMNRLGSIDSFLFIEKQAADGSWKEIERDGRWGTTVQWKAIALCINCRSATVSWQIPADAAGTYRIVHKGNYKPSWILPDVVEYRSATAPFELKA